MHICLPDTREVRPTSGSAYLLYNIHIDGLYHCSLRYKQLLHLHQELAHHFTRPLHLLPAFPPKRLLPLSASQVEERRQLLEKYLQNISQDKAVCNSSIFNLFLLEAQRESTRIGGKQVHLDVELVNGQKIRVQIMSHDSADDVLTAVCRALGLGDRHHAYFCLCLCGYDVIRDKLIIKRKLSFFESPYVTLQMAIQQQERLQTIITNHPNETTQYNLNNNNNINTNYCRCPSCVQLRQQQLLSNSSNTVPLISSSSGQHVNTNNSGHYNHTCNRDGNNNQHHNQNLHCNENWSRQACPSTGATTSFVTHRILLRKSYWDPIYDTYILNDPQALNLLFIQTVYDMKHSLMFVDKDTYHQLESLLAADAKMEYILLARTLKYYNYVHFEPCYSDYPRPRTKVMISIGSKELNMRVLKSPRSLDARPAVPQPPVSQASITTSSTSTANLQQTPSTITTITNSNNHPQPTICTQQQSSPIPVTNYQQVSISSEQQILYCTSSLVPSGYQHLITKEDLIEEEYNFKVPLIRCWRLTSLEFLNSSSGNNNSNAFIKTPNRAHRGLSLFGGNSSSENKSTADCANNSCARRTLIGTGNGGYSLIAALTGTRSGTSFRSTANQLNLNSNQHQHCQNENYTCKIEEHQTEHSQPSQYELSFEYLVSKDTLRWVTISSDQAIFISISLQGVVDELVSKRDMKASNYKGSSDAPNVLTTTSPNTTQAQNLTISDVSKSNNHKLTSFTYMYRDGVQKLLSTSNQQLIDKFGTTLGYSPSNPQALAMARHRHQIRASSSGGGQQLTNSSRPSANFSADREPEDIFHNHLQYRRHQQHAFEITNLKKAPIPIINDAFEGVTNEDDL